MNGHGNMELRSLESAPDKGLPNTFPHFRVSETLKNAKLPTNWDPPLFCRPDWPLPEWDSHPYSDGVRSTCKEQAGKITCRWQM